MRTANPALNKKTFVNLGYAEGTNQMTLQGTVNKTLIMMALLLIAASFTWRMFFSATSAANPAEGARAVMPWMIGGVIGGLIVALITIFKKTAAPITAPIYAILEGLFLGALSSFMEARFPGIVIQAVALTFGTLFALLFLYKSRIIKPTENFKLGVVAATGGIFLVYLVTMILRLFGVGYISFIHGSGTVGILFSLFVVVIAALNLVLDFDFIETGTTQGAPKYMEWYGAFGLMVTLVWLYIEILRLLAKLQSKR
ncbi:MAG: Bax inhibitor-1/YccA family protein [Candidatus Aminicenantes bacterium]|nr:MAG: Bax inhibitor-1/YccA family protein [Candidatus Aminicenantes bacterium]